jgi:hypothetical protein
MNGGVGGSGLFGTVVQDNTELLFSSPTTHNYTNNSCWQLFYATSSINLSSIIIGTATSAITSTSGFKLYYTISNKLNTQDFSDALINPINITTFTSTFSNSVVNNVYYTLLNLSQITIPTGYYFMIGMIGGPTGRLINKSLDNLLLNSQSTNSHIVMLNKYYTKVNDANVTSSSTMTLPTQLYGSDSNFLLLNGYYSAMILNETGIVTNAIKYIKTRSTNLSIFPDGGFGGGSASLVYDNLYPLISPSAGYTSGFSSSIDSINNIYTNNYAGAGGSYWNNNLVVYGNYGPKNNDTFGFVKVTLYSINSIIDNSIQNGYILSQQELDMIAFSLVHILYIISIIGLYKINTIYTYYTYLSLI